MITKVWIREHNFRFNTYFDSVISEEDWEDLIDNFRTEKVIICLGPNFYSSSETGLESELALHLRSREKELGIRVYDNGWFHGLNGAHVPAAYRRIKSFHRIKNEVIERRLDKLADIPFHFVLNFNPDYRLRDTLAEKQFQHSFSSFDRDRAFDASLPVNVYPPTRLSPLVFNMLGELDETNSLVYTYSDFYKYMNAIFADKYLPDVLRENIYGAESYVFIGMPFDRWYVHMFMRMMQQEDPQKANEKFAVNLNITDEVATQSFEQYRMTFVPTDIDQFLDDLHTRCRTAGKLREADDCHVTQIPFAELKEMMKDGKHEEVLHLLDERLVARGVAGREWLNTVLLLTQRQRKLRRNVIERTISSEQEVLDGNLIARDILDLLDDLRRRFA